MILNQKIVSKILKETGWKKRSIPGSEDVWEIAFHDEIYHVPVSMYDELVGMVNLEQCKTEEDIKREVNRIWEMKITQ